MSSFACLRVELPDSVAEAREALHGQLERIIEVYLETRWSWPRRFATVSGLTFLISDPRVRQLDTHELRDLAEHLEQRLFGAAQDGRVSLLLFEGPDPAVQAFAALSGEALAAALADHELLPPGGRLTRITALGGARPAASTAAHGRAVDRAAAAAEHAPADGVRSHESPRPEGGAPMAGPDRKVAFVTGAASGIGRKTAELFLERGYAVALVDLQAGAGAQAEAELRSRGDCAFIACDVADEASVQAAVDQAVARFGRIDAAFNAAGIGGSTGLTAEGELQNFRRVLDIDLIGVWLCMRAEIRAMLRTGGGAIVNCASLAGLRGSPGLHAYVAAKHGVVGLTRTAALEYARQGIRVNAVCPGLVETPMTQDIPAKIAEQINALTPLGRIGQPQEIASAVLWLCDPGAGFVTGQALPIDGGWTAR